VRSWDRTEYFVAEVYYDDRGRPYSWTDREEFNALAGWDDVEDLRETIVHIQEALQQPVLRVSDDQLSV
jgi:hypothetical protein